MAWQLVRCGKLSFNNTLLVKGNIIQDVPDDLKIHFDEVIEDKPTVSDYIIAEDVNGTMPNVMDGEPVLASVNGKDNSKTNEISKHIKNNKKGKR